MKYYLGIDVGGTKVAVGLVTGEGRVLSHVREPTAEARRSPGILASLVRLSRRAAAEAGVEWGSLAAAGIVLPGPTDPRGPTMLAAPTIPELEGVPLSPSLGVELGLPLAGDNDANAIALAEARFGAARGARVAVYLTISTGIGGGVVADGQLFRGASGTAGEFGHLVVEPDGEPCACGGAGCLETVASGPAIARRARRLLPRHPESVLADRSWRAGRSWDAHLLADAARQGDAMALHVWEDVGERLGLAVASIINLFDADCVVLGGGVMGAADLLLPTLRQVAAERAMPVLGRPVSVAPAALGEDAGIVGAAALGMAGGGGR